MIASVQRKSVFRECGYKGPNNTSSGAEPLLWGTHFGATHKKMNGGNEQELREVIRLKHHSRQLKKHASMLSMSSLSVTIS